MLPYQNRLRRPAEFRSVIATGRRVRRGALVMHHVADRTPRTDSARSGPAETIAPAPIVGFVVGRAVGNSVVRHRVTRRLRAQMQARLQDLPPASATVVRALAGCGDLDSATLGRDLDLVLARLK